MLQKWPLMFQLMSASNTYNDFTEQVQALNPSLRNRYNIEYQAWYNIYGRIWDRIGCVQENTVGEHTKRFAFQDNAPTTRPFRNNGNMSGVNLRIGALGDLPKLPTGYSWCRQAPTGLAMVTTERAIDGMYGWTQQVWSSSDGKYLYYLFRDSMTNEDYWACPPTFRISSVASEVKQIQSALLNKGFNPGPIDGSWGPKTCQAAYSFQRNTLKEYGSTLTSRFFFALGVSGLGSKYARSCDDWYTGDLGPDPDFVPPATPLAVKKALLKLGYSVGPMVDVWDRDVCTAAFKFKKAVLGEQDDVLGKSFFEKLGLAGTLDVTDCKKYAGQAASTPVAQPEPEAPAAPVVEESKAGFGWVAIILGLGAIGTVAYQKWKEGR